MKVVLHLDRFPWWGQSFDDSEHSAFPNLAAKLDSIHDSCVCVLMLNTIHQYVILEITHSVMVFVRACVRVCVFVQVNYILEAFGHAQTPRNSNASRFIKLLSLQYCERRRTLLRGRDNDKHFHTHTSTHEQFLKGSVVITARGWGSSPCSSKHGQQRSV